MKTPELLKIRLLNQHISGNKLDSAKALILQMGAMQAQDYSMAKYAAGLRIKDATEEQINQAIDDGEIIRTHLLRPTWHFIAAENLDWIRQLTAPAIKASMKSRNRELELSDKVFRKSLKVIKEALDGGNSLTREELTTILKKAKISTDNNRASHLFMEAELEGIICSGKSKGNKQTYALIEDRIPKNVSLKSEDAISKLAGIYFSSRGPATIEDFAWWSGVAKTKIKNALGLSGTDSGQEELKKYWNKKRYETNISEKSVFLLPAFDEYMISYKDRSAMISSINHKKTISSNGIFYPLIVENGIVIGNWKRTIKKDKIIIEAECNQAVNKKTKDSIEHEAIIYGTFLGKDAAINTIRTVKNV